jgi:hypothetical protein
MDHKIYAVYATHIYTDYPWSPTVVSYHKSLKSAKKKADEINKGYGPTENGYWYNASVKEVTISN